MSKIDTRPYTIDPASMSQYYPDNAAGAGGGGGGGGGSAGVMRNAFGSIRGKSWESKAGAGDVNGKFKAKLEEVGDNYLPFFQERIQIEEKYVNSLEELYMKTRAWDIKHEEFFPSPQLTSRQAFIQTLDHTLRESDSRRAFLEALKEAVVKPLERVRDEQKRIAGRIKEDLRRAGEMYDDQANTKLPRLKKVYVKKCLEVEEQKRQDAAIALQAKLLADPINPASVSSTSPSHDEKDMGYFPSHGLFGGGKDQHGPPVISAPAPPASNPALPEGFSYPVPVAGPPPVSIAIEPMESPPGRRRAGSASNSAVQAQAKEVLGELMGQGKRGFGAIMSRLGGEKRAGGDREDEGWILPETSSAGTGDRLAPAPRSFGVTSRDPTVPAPSPMPTGVPTPPISPQPLSGERGAGIGLGLGTSLVPARDREVNMPPGGGREGVGKPAMALRGVKLRREMDEADKAYRQAVFDLETMRLRRNKIQIAAHKSLEQFQEDLTSTLQDTLMTYVDCLSATSATNAQMSSHVRKAVEEIDEEADMELHMKRHALKPRSLTEPVLYDNFYVGPCRSLIFSLSLNDYDYQRGEGGDHGSPPLIVVKAVAELDRRGLDSEGLYRVSGRQASLQSMINSIEQDEVAFQFKPGDDVFTISGVLKQYLRALPEPVFPFPLVERIKHTENRESHISSNFSVLRAKLSRLPTIHQTTLQLVVEHLARVAAHSATNKMNAKNLAVIFGTALFGEEDLPKDGDLANYPTGKDTLAADMIEYAPLLFGEDEIVAPVLPAGMAVGRSGSLQYSAENERLGSSHTKARLPSPRSPVSQSSLPPVLPPRPVEVQRRASTLDSPDMGGDTVSAGLTPIRTSSPLADAQQSPSASDVGLAEGKSPVASATGDAGARIEQQNPTSSESEATPTVPVTSDAKQTSDGDT